MDSSSLGEFALYETSIDLATLGVEAQTLQSITFQDPDPAHGTMGVFAVEGTPVPEPAVALSVCAPLLLLRRRDRR